MTDIISQATRLALNSHVNYNPGFPLVYNHRPITTPRTLGNPEATTENIYKEPYLYGKTPSRRTIARADIDGKVVNAIITGQHGCSTDYLGCLMLTFFMNEPTQWDNLFWKAATKLELADIFVHITGLKRVTALGLLNLSDNLFKKHGNYSPQTHEIIIRANLEF